jgi:acyl carrier protein
MDNATRIRDFIRQEVLFEEDGTSLRDDTLLLDGAMDSLGLMQLVAFLEEAFGIEIDDEDVTADHFRTVADIERLVGQKVPSTS